MTELEQACLDARNAMVASGICENCKSFNDCLSRLSSTASSLRLSGVGGGEGSRERPFDWRFFMFLILLMISCFISFVCFSADCEITEVEDDGYYITCYVPNEWDGSGDDPGGNGGGGGVTNCFGACTNCVQFSPAQMAAFKEDAGAQLGQLIHDCGDIVSECGSITSEVYKIEHAADGLQYYTGAVSGNSATVGITNFIYQYIASVSDQNLVKAAYEEAISRISPSGLPGYYRAGQLGAWNGALSAYQSAGTSLAPVKQSVKRINDQVDDLNENAELLREKISNLPETPCQGSGGGGGGDGGTCDNPNFNDWCTEEQGEAIIFLLEDLKTYVDKSRSTLGGISNLVFKTRQTIISSLWTTYTALPKNLYSGQDIGQEATNKSWKTFYLEAGDQGKDFGYDPTNILQRIELLLYGISGVAEDDKESPLEDDDNSRSNAVSQVSNSFGDISSSMLDDDRSSLESIQTAFNSFFSAFSGAGNTDLSDSDIFIPSATINVGSSEITVPAFTYGSSENTSLANQMKVTARIFCTILYLLGAAFVLWKYWVWFGSYAVKFTRWATELLSSLFAS